MGVWLHILVCTSTWLFFLRDCSFKVSSAAYRSACSAACEVVKNPSLVRLTNTVGLREDLCPSGAPVVPEAIHVMQNVCVEES